MTVHKDSETMAENDTPINNIIDRICLMQLYWNSGVYWKFATSRRMLGGQVIINFSQFQFSHSSSYSIFAPVSCGRQLHVFLEQFTHSLLDQGGQKGPYLPSIRDLRIDCCFLSYRAIVVALPPIISLQTYPPMAKVTSRFLKGLDTFPSLHFALFLLLGSRY